jgi:uncharacterized protein (DUF1499 family)
MLGWLMGLVFPACAHAGAAGLSPPMLIQFSAFERPATPNAAIAAPENFLPVAPDIVVAAFAMAPDQLRARVRAAAEAAGAFPHGTTGAQDHWVARSKLFNFPDLVTAQVFAHAGGGATLVLYSRSVYGRSDLGANRARLQRWLAAIGTPAP